MSAQDDIVSAQDDQVSAQDDQMSAQNDQCQRRMIQVPSLDMISVTPWSREEWKAGTQYRQWSKHRTQGRSPITCQETSLPFDFPSQEGTTHCIYQEGHSDVKSLSFC